MKLQQLLLVKMLCPSYIVDKTDNSLQTISHLTKIINQSTIKLLNQRRHSQSFKGKQYRQLESLLQKQQSNNRNFIKHELEAKQFQKQIMEELLDQRQQHLKLSIRHDHAIQQLRIRDVQILHLKNENKCMFRDKLTTTDSHTKSSFIEKKVQQLLSRDTFHSSTKKNRKGHIRRNSDGCRSNNNTKKNYASLSKR